MTTAILVVDVQRGMVEGDHAVDGADALLARLARLLERARAEGTPVLHLQDEGTTPGSLIARETPAWDLVLPVADGETVVHKSEDDGFVETELHHLLADREVSRVVLVGVQSEMCVAATARGALERGYAVVLPRDGHTTYDVPADERGGLGVPAGMVSRVAEWSLGDTIEVPASVDEVDLTGQGLPD